ncbi:unnamed protein product [Chrysoparadoxa australica]
MINENEERYQGEGENSSAGSTLVAALKRLLPFTRKGSNLSMVLPVGEPEDEVEVQSASTASGFDSERERELLEEDESIRRYSKEWADSDIPFPMPLRERGLLEEDITNFSKKWADSDIPFSFPLNDDEPVSLWNRPAQRPLQSIFSKRSTALHRRGTHIH